MSPPDQQELRGSLIKLSQSTGMPVHFVGETINTVLIGEQHWRFDKGQASLCSWIEPSAILLEKLGGFMYNPNESVIMLQDGRKTHQGELDLNTQLLQSDPKEMLGGVLPFLEVSNELQIPLLGCDITFMEMWEIATSDPQNQEEPLHKMRAEGKDDAVLGIIRARTRLVRDRFIADYIRDRQGTSIKPVVAIVGWEHAKYIFDNQILTNYCFYEMVPEQTRKKLGI